MVAGGDPRAADFDLARGHAIPKGFTFGAHQADLDKRRRPALFGANFVFFFLRPVAHVRPESAGGADGSGPGNTPKRLICRPKRSRRRMSSRGGAVPPQTTRMGASNFQRPGFFSSASRTAIQTVGTPQAIVTRSPTIKPSMLSGSTFGPGSTRRAPSMVHAKGSPQALAWKIGATGRPVSNCLIPKCWPRPQANECSTSAGWASVTPLKGPIVLDVK